MERVQSEVSLRRFLGKKRGLIPGACGHVIEEGLYLAVAMDAADGCGATRDTPSVAAQPLSTIPTARLRNGGTSVQRDARSRRASRARMLDFSAESPDAADVTHHKTTAASGMSNGKRRCNGNSETPLENRLRHLNRSPAPTPLTGRGRPRSVAFLSPSIEYTPHPTVLCFADPVDRGGESARAAEDNDDEDDDGDLIHGNLWDGKLDDTSVRACLGSASRVRVMASMSPHPGLRRTFAGTPLPPALSPAPPGLSPSCTLWATRGITPCRLHLDRCAEWNTRLVLYSQCVPEPGLCTRRVLRNRSVWRQGGQQRPGGRAAVPAKRPRSNNSSSSRNATSNADAAAALVALTRQRETGNLPPARLRAGTARERFRNMHLCHEYDANSYNKHFALPFLRRRAKIVEIVASAEIVFTLGSNGICSAFSRATGRRLCCLNVAPDEIIRSLFLNRLNDSLITVSVREEDRFSSLRCRSTPLDVIRRGRPDCGFALFESDSLKWPGFVEFDDVNGKVLTFSASDRSYTVWDLATYRRLYRIGDRRIDEVKISPGLMLLIHHREASNVPLQLVCIESGRVVGEFHHLLNRSRKVEFIEHFNDKLLVKQEQMNLKIIDIKTKREAEVPASQHMTPSAFIFLYENKLFLTFRNREVQVWDFGAERIVSEFEDHRLWHSTPQANNIYITSAQDVLVSYCRPAPRGSGDDAEADGGAWLRPPEEASSPPPSALDSDSGLEWDVSVDQLEDSGTEDALEASVARRLPLEADEEGFVGEAATLTPRIPVADVARRTSAAPILGDVDDDRDRDALYDDNIGAIHISSIVDGRILARLRARKDNATERAALEDVTALFYNEERNEIYCGTRSGFLYVWAV